jgi:DNA-binding NtrC family response regulator
VDNARADENQVTQTNPPSPGRAGLIANVLIGDDDPQTAGLILRILAQKGIRGIIADTAEAAIDSLDRADYDLVFIGDAIRRRVARASRPCSDFIPQNAFDLLHRIKQNSPEMPVIMMADPSGQDAWHSHSLDCARDRSGRGPTGFKPVPLQQIAAAAVKAVRAGCCEFLVKPLDLQKLRAILDTLLPNHTVQACESAEHGIRSLYQIVGKSKKLLQTVTLAKKIAPTSVPVLISGESGTGKELISYLIHHNSKRAQAPYIKVNCAALSDTLLESELFGHEKGAFTGAYNQRKGRFEMAHGGTLLLDEITETPMKFQAKLLRVLEQQNLERVGGNDNIKINVRIISTTNKNLLHEVEQGRFRRDLYYRLSAVRLIICPLSQRTEDLPDLVWHFVNLYAREAQRRITTLDPAMMDIFAKYHWPGNVRQLRNVVLTSLLLGVGQTLSLADVSWLFDELQPRQQENTQWHGLPARQTTARPVPIQACPEPSRRVEGMVVPAAASLGGIPLVEIEKQAILDTLRQTEGNRTEAARVLGISDRTLRDKIRRYRQAESLQPVG